MTIKESAPDARVRGTTIRCKSDGCEPYMRASGAPMASRQASNASFGRSNRCMKTTTPHMNSIGAAPLTLRAATNRPKHISATEMRTRWLAPSFTMA